MDDAIRELETAVKLRPNFRMFYLELAKAYMEEDEYDSRSINCIIRYRKSSIFAGDP